jgi:hypothetical protein
MSVKFWCFNLFLSTPLPLRLPLPPLTTISYEEQVANMLLKALFSALVIVRAYTLLTLIHILL